MRFCENCGADMVICQECGRDVCTKHDETKYVKGKGNICRDCGELETEYAVTWRNIDNGEVQVIEDISANSLISASEKAYGMLERDGMQMTLVEIMDVQEQ
jgi:hypothetical protein